MWGANAANGIINIITKHAKNTQGGLVTDSAGSEERGMGGVRYGDKIGDNAYFRVYSKYYNHDDFVQQSGAARMTVGNRSAAVFDLTGIPLQRIL